MNLLKYTRGQYELEHPIGLFLRASAVSTSSITPTDLSPQVWDLNFAFSSQIGSQLSLPKTGRRVKEARKTDSTVRDSAPLSLYNIQQPATHTSYSPGVSKRFG